MSTEAHPADIVEQDRHGLPGGSPDQNGSADNGHEPPKSDRLSGIRARREELKAKRSLLLVVPGYAGVVGVRYKTLPREEIGEWVNKLIDREPSINDNIDLLIRCCQEVLVRQDKDSPWEAFDLDKTEPTTFQTGNLAQLLGEDPVKTAREEVRTLFSPEGTQPMSPESHAEALIHWQQDADYQVDRQLLGE